jgi:hypothetical protein
MALHADAGVQAAPRQPHRAVARNPDATPGGVGRSTRGGSSVISIVTLSVLIQHLW